MSFISIRELSQLVNSSGVERGYEEMAVSFSKKYGLKLQLDDFQGLIETAIRINKREKTKELKSKRVQMAADYQIFVFGELKIFNWVLVLYSHIHNLDLNQFTDCHVSKIQAIFKKKSKLFIDYQINDIIYSKQKQSKEWSEVEIELLKEIMKEKENESEWKSISYCLFAKSQGRFFKSFAMCREKWINHLNPNVKKTEWTLEEDVELFNMIKGYGCRWALISRELKGMRSEHSVKNRYNMLAKTIKRQYRLGDTSMLNQKILKYLKMKLDKQKQTEESLNSSGDSLDSKFSRERSREEEKNKLNLSQDSREEEEVCENKFNLFDDEVNYLELPNTGSSPENGIKYETFNLRNYYKDFKEERKTNDKQEDEEESEKLEPCLLTFENQESSSVKPSTLEELDFEYNRLLNLTDGKNEMNGCFLDLEGRDQFGNGNYWMFEAEEKPISWSDLDE